MADKIWVVSGVVYRTEKGFLKAIEESGDYCDYQIFTGSKPKKAKELREQLAADKEASKRDLSIAAVLGELTTEQKKELAYESDINELIKVVKEIVDKNTGNNSKRRVYSNLCRLKDNRSKLLRYIIECKRDILSFSPDVEYYKALLKIHKFQSLTMMATRWVTGGRTETYDRLGLSKPFHDAFNEAKEQLKKSK